MNDQPKLIEIDDSFTFTAGGEWLHNGEVIQHQRINRYLSSHVRYSSVYQQYVLSLGLYCISFEYEDSPLLAVELVPSELACVLRLNNEQSYELSRKGLVVSASGVWYAHLAKLPGRIRLRRTLVASLQEFVSSSNGSYALTRANCCYPIVQE